MNIQQEITEQEAKFTNLRTLVSKNLSQWTIEEKSRYGNIETASVEKDLVLNSIELLKIELLFETPYEEWTIIEKRKYGNQAEAAYEQLRREKYQLRKKEEQLRNEKEQLRNEKDLVLNSIELLKIELLFETPYEEWTIIEKRKYGNQAEAAYEQLRKEKYHLRKKEEQLRNEKDLVLNSIELLKIQLLFETPYEEWTIIETRKYGNQAEAAYEQLRKEVDQLLKQKNILLRLKEKSSKIYWKVSGTVLNSLKGVRCRLYRNADKYLGYYESGQPALFYEENQTTIRINVLFKSEEHALHFDSKLRNERITIGSPMNNLEIISDVSETSTAQFGERIYYTDYIPTDYELSKYTQSVVTIQCSVFEKTSDEFKFQRIESLSVFSSFGNAESCHLVSESHCKNYPQSYSQYDNDPNNRLAMSRELHGWFDQLSLCIPLFYLKVVSISDSVVIENRYQVVLGVVAVDQESANNIFGRLIEGSTKTDNPLVMNTSVYVTKPDIFKKCLEWKEQDTIKKWNDYFSMDSAVP